MKSCRTLQVGVATAVAAAALPIVGSASASTMLDPGVFTAGIYAAPMGGSGGLIATASTARCPPGRINLRVLGPQNVSPGTLEHYTLVAKVCKTPTPTLLRGVTLQASGPRLEKLRWHVSRLHDGQTKREPFDVHIAEGVPGASLGVIVVKALAKSGRQLGRGSLPIHVRDSQPPTGREEPGIYLANNDPLGPLTDVKLDTPYTYSVGVVPALSYVNGAVAISVPSSSCRAVATNIRFVAGQRLTVRFRVDFILDRDADRGIIVDELSPPSATGSELLAQKTFPVTFTPNQTPLPHPGTGNGGNEYCGPV